MMLTMLRVFELRRVVVAAILCVLPSICLADTLILRNGTRIDGTIIGFASRTIKFRHADGVTRRYPTSEVAAVEFVSADRANPRAIDGRDLQLPAGTELVVRMVETVDSHNSGADQTFSGIVQTAVVTSTGSVMIPERSSVQLVIRQRPMDSSNARPRIVLDVQSVTIEGRRYVVSPNDVFLASEAAAQVLTEGRDVDVPSETILRFRLPSAATLRAEH